MSLHLQSIPGSETVHGPLSIYKLEDVPTYTYLLYTVGDAPVTLSMVCIESTLAVTKNVGNLFKIFRRKSIAPSRLTQFALTKQTLKNEHIK